ncbi:MAG: hypothetical protein AUJ37_00515 [Candidatus Magasanikbacteria bacterium CG1_02_41_34]|uniref:Glycosyltransferase 2-like domain-containing protein n=1 Tax=Candidatus Magasanikbacteria bacterium CG_4_10_14_0_2_um_filter_41_31 TaxID=1974639 RepID=A0A2M7V4N8_9BACT|nr:MAG: hypothetical protein AUJ37_00515 [Candidatus Magasanikbacteria bacterium CG1_02_41_34]PIZ93525.1 MAG: hypothetical protein COX83_01760 [Candidatus Magasanikbacteria bacterium CG_4_10_14_0_2_um_filter_41_31]
MKKLTVQLVTWNGETYIPYLFESLAKQTFTDWKLVVLDNASEDKTLANIREAIETQQLSNFQITESPTNSGFAGGHNALFQKTQGEYVLLLNQDMYLMPDAFEKMVLFLDTHDDVAAVSPRLMKWDVDSISSKDDLQKSFTDTIDSLGLKVFRNRRVIEKYAGKEWSTVKPKMNMSFHAERFREDGMALEVFGVSGAFPMLRRSAVSAVTFSDGTFLDSDYHAYKEDVDLAFRLRSAGYRSFVLLETIAYHDRSAAGQEDLGHIAATKNKKKQSSWVAYHSYKNHLMTLYKNEYWQNYLLDAFFITWYELKKFGWFLFFKRSVLKGCSEIWILRKALKKKRLEIKQKRRVSWKELRAWWR